MLALSPDRKTITLPALTSAHSHAFQFEMRGAAQRRGQNPLDDFWSWRGQMYRVASSLTPESIHAISRIAFHALARAGVHTVGEFHYVHHQQDGTPYADRTILSDVVIRAAREEGLRIALLRVAYNRAGPGKERENEQRRFCDESVDAVLRDVDTLRAKYKHDPHVKIGVAPHSVRAVPPSWLGPIAEHANTHALPVHMHVAEQQREVAECMSETGRRPVELLAERGILSNRFVAVHATHLTHQEARLLGEVSAFACICATTERDLGDGLPDISALRAAGARLCTGIDSHIITDPVEDLRAIETHERLRTETRVTHAPASGSLAEQLWREGSLAGANACGFEDDGAELTIERDHPTIARVPDHQLLDAIVFSGSASMVSGVVPIVRERLRGSHARAVP